MPQRWWDERHLAVTVMAALAIAAPVAAQPPVASTVEWSVAAGYQTFAFRDISRNMRPPDASPVSWRGDGPAVSGTYKRSAERSRHVVAIGLAQAGNFSYTTPLAALPGGTGDGASRVSGLYEYRRHLLRNKWFDGLRLSAGVQGVGSRLSLERDIAGGFFASSTMVNVGVAGVIAAEFDRWRFVRVQAEWANGAAPSRRQSEHSADRLSKVTASGWNWLSDLMVSADWLAGRRLRITTAWRRGGSEYASSHFSFSERRQSWSIGVTHER